MTAIPGRTGVVICRTMEDLALALWVGGLIAIIAAVIPGVFNTFSMEQAGRFLRRVFDGYNRLVAVAVGLFIVAAVGRRWLTRRTEDVDRRRRGEGPMLGVMIAVAAAIFILTPRVVALQEQVFAATEAARQAALDEFFRLHHLVRALYFVNLILGIGLIAMRARTEENRTA